MGKKGKKKTASSTETFRFVDNNPMVVANLSAPEIAKVKKWQASEEYVFEFHEGHTIGQPIYLRPTEGLSRTEANIPKINTLGVAKDKYATILNIENGGKLKANLSDTAQKEIMAIIKNEWEALVTLADRYWNDKEPPASVQVQPERKCQGKTCGKQYSASYDLGEPNEHGKWTCPKCGKPVVEM